MEIPTTHTHEPSATPERRFDREPGGLECLRCRHVFAVEDFARIRDAGHDRTYVQCAWCDARNEIRAMPRSGLGVQPSAVVVRIMNER